MSKMLLNMLWINYVKYATSKIMSKMLLNMPWVKLCQICHEWNYVKDVAKLGREWLYGHCFT